MNDTVNACGHQLHWLNIAVVLWLVQLRLLMLADTAGKVLH